MTPQSVVALQPPSVASKSVVPLQPLGDAPAHRWAVPLKLHLAIDSTGKTQGCKKVDYTRHVVSELAAENNINLTVAYIPGKDLPELTAAIKMKSHDNDAHVLISMSNYSVDTLDKPDVSQHIFEACRDLSQEPAPVKVIYGGPGELWHACRGGNLDIFERKTQTIRTYLEQLGIDVESGAEDFRAQFSASDLDNIGHFLGRCCGERPRAWLTTQLLRFSCNLWMSREGDVAPRDMSKVGCAKNMMVGKPQLCSTGLSTERIQAHSVYSHDEWTGGSKAD